VTQVLVLVFRTLGEVQVGGGVTQVFVASSTTFGSLQVTGVTHVLVVVFKTLGEVQVGGGVTQVFVASSKTSGSVQVVFGRVQVLVLVSNTSGSVQTGVGGGTATSEPIGANGLVLPSSSGVGEASGILESRKLVNDLLEKIVSSNFIFLTFNNTERKSLAITEFWPKVFEFGNPVLVEEETKLCSSGADLIKKI